MATLQLGFKAFDPHELLCHFMAVQAGFYTRRDLQIGLLDTTFIPDDKLAPDVCQVACGAALLGWLQGAAIKVLAVAVDRPMFWLYGRGRPGDLAALKGMQIASFPPVAPPAEFLNIVLRRAGLDPARDVKVMAARDDTARFGLLISGDVKAAVISSAIPPAVIASAGFSELAFFGDIIRIPTTGLAVRQALLDRQPDAVRALVSAHAEALTAIHQDDERLRAVLSRYFRVEAAALGSCCERVRRCFTTDGRSPPAVTQAAVEMVARALAVSSPRAPEDLYDFSCLPGK